jgi:hypothetical protein
MAGCFDCWANHRLNSLKSGNFGSLDMADL